MSCMRFIISNVTDKMDCSYLGLTAVIKDWFVKKEGIANSKEATLKLQTDKGMLFSFKNGQEHWIPKSLITFRKRVEQSLQNY
ncbi:Uncharacterised protein [uncultured archaeon]|nr:Uncharacterised protein [uncultured archaeon]